MIGKLPIIHWSRREIEPNRHGMKAGRRVCRELSQQARIDAAETLDVVNQRSAKRCGKQREGLRRGSALVRNHVHVATYVLVDDRHNMDATYDNP